jgi:hypothetical protein
MGLEPATFGATIRRTLLLGVAVRCRIGLDKPISLLMVAHCFCVLRAEWCQKWCQTILAREPSSVGCVFARTTSLGASYVPF